MTSARAVLDRWIELVNIGDLEGILGLYAQGATLLPTFSSSTLRTTEDRRRYFTGLASRPQLKVLLRDNSVTQHRLGEACVALTGLYVFQFELDQQLMSFESRFTFVLEPSAAAPIQHHHSSQIPRGIN